MSRKSKYSGFWNFAYIEHRWSIVLQFTIALCMFIGVSMNYFAYGWIVMVFLVLWFLFGCLYRIYHIWKNLKE